MACKTTEDVQSDGNTKTVKFNATPVDLNEEKIAEARAAAHSRLAPGADIEFRVQNAAELPASPLYDRGLCMGATFAFCMGPAGYERALTGLKQLVIPGVPVVQRWTDVLYGHLELNLIPIVLFWLQGQFVDLRNVDGRQTDTK